MAITDDAVRERHGVSCREGTAGYSYNPSQVTIWEDEEYVSLGKTDEIRRLTPWQARYLAAKLYRLARRIRQRGEAK